MDVETLIRRLGLAPLPLEGGYFKETYRSSIRVAAEALGAGYSGARSVGTAIYFLLTPLSFSAMHSLPGDETYHFYLGAPVFLLVLHPDGGSEEITLGTDLEGGMVVQYTVPGGSWQGSRLFPGGDFALLGTTMSPGFDVEDFELGHMADLVRRYPDRRALIESLVR
ncbi:cupin domain-containing protein [Gemmatimonadota bacterium]